MVLSEARVEERRREKQLGDDRWALEGFYVFQVRFGSKSTVVPLVLNPDTYSLSEPFSMTTAPGLNGSLYVEENGIVFRRIQLGGTFGLSKKRIPFGTSLPSEDNPPPASFVRKTENPGTEPISGQKHFEILQDRIFRFYGDLKRDPYRAEDAHMFFYNLKDDEHYEVKPEEFRTSRVSRVLHRYDITLLAVDTAKSRAPEVWSRNPAGRPRGLPPLRSRALDDGPASTKLTRGELAKLRGALADVEDPSFLDRLNKAVNEELAALKRSPLYQAIGRIRNTIRVVKGIADEVERVVKGVIDFIRAPIELVKNAIQAIDDIITSLRDLTIGLGNAVLGSFRSLSRVLCSVASRPETFLDGTILRTKNWKRLLFPDFGEADLPLLNTDSPERPEDLDNGTAPTPSQVRANLRDPGNARSRGSQRALTSSRQSRLDQVGQGETLIGLASRTLGDSSRWREIVELNQLRAPYFSESGIPFTLRPGDPVLIPDDQGPAEGLNAEAVLGASPEDPLEERLLGVDFKLVPNSDGLFDWEITGKDLRKVRGVENLQQGLRTTILQPRGELPIYPDFGTDVQVGRPRRTALALARVEIITAVESDPRISGTQRVITPTNEQDDVVGVEMEAVVAGLRRSEVVQVPL